MNPITVFQLASWTIGLWDYWLVGIEAGAGPIMPPPIEQIQLNKLMNYVWLIIDGLSP